MEKNFKCPFHDPVDGCRLTIQSDATEKALAKISCINEEEIIDIAKCVFFRYYVNKEKRNEIQ